MSCRYLTIIIAFNALAGYSAYADIVPQTKSTETEKSDEPTTSPAVEGESATLSTEKTLPSVEAPAETAEMPPLPEEKPSPCARVTNGADTADGDGHGSEVGKAAKREGGDDHGAAGALITEAREAARCRRRSFDPCSG